MNQVQENQNSSSASIEKAGETPDSVTCVERVYRDAWSSGYHCLRKPGFGPGGQYCRQHGEKRGNEEPTATWYRTSKWAFAIEEVAVISATDKRVLIKDDYTGKPSRQNIQSEYYQFWPTREEAVDFLRKRLENKRNELAKAEAEFQRTSAGRGEK